MSNLVKSGRNNSKNLKTIGRFGSPEEAARSKNSDLIAQVKKMGLKVIKANTTFK